jgi:hypothetical protein
VSQQNAPENHRGRVETWLIAGLAIVGLALVVLFGLRAARNFMRIDRSHLDPRAPRVEEIRGWMTLPRLAQVFHVPEPYLYEQLGVTPEDARRMDLRELSRQQSPDAPEEFMERVQEALRSYPTERPPPR